MPYKGSTEAQRRAVAKFQKEKVDTIAVRVPKGQKDYYKAAADLSGKPSLNQFIIDAMDEKIENEGLRNKVKRKLLKQQKP